METQRKRAWLSLAVFAVWFPAWLALFGASGYDFFHFYRWAGDPVRVMLSVALWLGVVALCLVPLFFRARTDKSPVTEDERDRAIARRANLTGGSVSYLTFVGACGGLYVLYAGRGEDCIPAGVLPAIVFAGAIAFFLGQTVSILVQYRREHFSAQD